MLSQKVQTHNMPVQLTPFIGREPEIAQIVDLLKDEQCRLLTLVGPGGNGKTRLSIESISRLTNSDFEHGVFYVPLASLTSADNIVTTVISVLGIQIGENGVPQDELTQFLSQRNLLLLLDNFEHVKEGAGLVVDILDSALDVKVLVTSRKVLNLRMERVWHVRGMRYPNSGPIDDIEPYSALKLFIDRAIWVQREFSWVDNQSCIIRICQLVGGMPLAIELASSWLKTLSCQDIIIQIDHGIDILSTSARDIPERHRSIRAVLDQSWQLLTEDERVLLPKLIVFRGGFTLQIAEYVAGASLQTLAPLIDKSLVQLGSNGRYDLHELVRQYLSEKLDKTPETREKVLDRHCDYFTEFLRQQEKTIHLGIQEVVLRELDNVRSAWIRAAQQHNLEALQQAAPSLHWLYHIQSWYDEGSTMFYHAEEALHELPITDEGRFLLGMIQLTRYLYQTRQTQRSKQPQVDIDTALAFWDGLNERPEMSLPLVHAMIAMLNRSDPEQVITAARKTLALAKRHDDLAGVAISLTSLAILSYRALGKFAKAQQHLREALAIDRQIGFDLNAAWSQGELGYITNLQGKYRATRAHFEARVHHFHIGGIVNKGMDMCLIELGNSALELKEDAAASNFFAESIKTASNLRRYEQIARAKAGLGIVAVYQGDITLAAAYYEDSQTLLRSADVNAFNNSNYRQALDNPSLLALLLGHYDQALAHYEAIVSHFKNTGYRVPLMRAHSLAGHALVGLADQERAQQYLFDALQEAVAMGAFQVLMEAFAGIAQLSFMSPALTVELLAMIRVHSASNRYSRTQAKHVLAIMEAALSPDEYSASLERGKTLTLQSAVALVKPLGVDLKMSQREANQQLIDPLTPREIEVLQLVVSGLTNREIAEKLVISIGTVKKHNSNAFGKLGVKTRAQAIVQAHKLNLTL